MTIKVTFNKDEETTPEQDQNIKVVVGGKKEPQATIRLEITKNLNGDLIIKEHPMIDIFILPGKSKMVTFPKQGFGDRAYEAQKDVLVELSHRGVLDRNSIQGGMVYGALEAKIMSSDQVSPVQVLLYELEGILKTNKSDFQVYQQYEDDVEDRFLEPSDADSTEHGEIPPEEERRKKELDKPYYSYSGFGYVY
tara:strand:+ start:2029 stop:2610 length:582 start_codon:yes stop_codon:yes gene_type:complete